MMLGAYDFALMGGLLALCLLGLSNGLRVTALLAAGLGGCIALAMVVGSADGLLALVAAWFIVSCATVVLWLPHGRLATQRSRAAALLLSAGKFAAIAVLVTGALMTRLPEDGAVMRKATAYPIIAEVGTRLTARERVGTLHPAAILSYPEPIPPKPATEPIQVNLAARPIHWAIVTTFENRVTRILTGHTIAADRAPISFEVGGTVQQVNVALGERFHTGDVLAELDSTSLQIALDERRAALIEAEATAREANLTLERQRQLRDSDTVSQAALDRAEAAADVAQSRLTMALTGIRQAEDQLADVMLRAPFDGIVDERLIEPAQTIRAGQPVFEIQDAHAGYQIEMIVPETLIRRIEAGAEYRAVVFDGNDSPIIARVHEIGSRANATTGFPVTLDIVAQSAPIRAGMTVEVHLSLPLSDDAEARIGLAAIPYTALLPGDGAEHVSYVYDERSGTLQRRAITVAAREGATALVSDGLVPGEIVATRGLPFLKDGQPVALRGVGIARYDN